jgi:hypothetical protein
VESRVAAERHGAVESRVTAERHGFAGARSEGGCGGRPEPPM